MSTNKELLDVVDHLIPISYFSKGKTSIVINDIVENNCKYVILKNNQPKAVLISIKEFKEMNEKMEEFHRVQEIIKKMETHGPLQDISEEAEIEDIKKLLACEDLMIKWNNVTEEELNMLIGKEK